MTICFYAASTKSPKKTCFRGRPSGCVDAGRLILTLFGTTPKMQPTFASGCSQNGLWEAPFGSF